MPNIGRRSSDPGVWRSPAAEQRASDWEAPHLYGNMLFEDIQSRFYAYEWSVTLSGAPDEEASASVVSELLKELTRYPRGDVTQAVVDFCSSVSVDLARGGLCVLEMYSEPDGEAEGENLRMDRLPPWTIRQRLGVTSQIQTREDGGTYWRRLNDGQLIVLRLPPQLRRAFRRALRGLAQRDLLRMDDLSVQAASGRLPGYDYSFHQRYLDELAARLTREVGWDGRGLFLERATTGYRTYRELKFLRCWLVLVNTALSGLRARTRDASILGSHACDVVVSGPPTIEQVDRSIVAFADGSLTVDQIRDELLSPRST